MQDAQLLIQEACKIATAYLAGHEDRGEPVLRKVSAEELLERMDLTPPREGHSLDELLDDVRATLHYSVRTAHPGFSNQLFGDFDAAGMLGEWITALLNTSMYTFEVAPVVTLMELALMRHMCELVGWRDEAGEGEGVLTPGGSIANLMAVLAARNRCVPDAKQRGLNADDRLVLFMSAEAHYSTERAASVVGLGQDAVRKVAVDAQGRMQPDALEAAIQQALARGERPFFLCATASTTVAGAFDPLDVLADVAERHGLWFHVDAAAGGGVLLSPQHRALMRGCERADSVVWNPHKMMGVPLACSALLMRDRGRLAATNAMGADYLFHAGDDARYDLGDLSLQCGRRVDSLKLWLSWRALGDEGHARRIEQLFSLAGSLRELLAQRDAFELVREPQGCNTCFRYVPECWRGVPSGRERDIALGQASVELREALRSEGRLLINYAPVDGVPALRHVANNHRVTRADLSFLLDELERHGAALPQPAVAPAGSGAGAPQAPDGRASI
ncbi:MAG: glutamate decarboxylase [Planctomycetota bacterium]|nr:MAG: glutamate decarboxylase [Planctomycetota bacterium]